MVTKVILLLLLVGILVGFTQSADALLAVTSIFNGDPDSNGDTFDALAYPLDITTVTIGGSTYALVASTGNTGLQIIDISDPNFPLAVTSIFDGDPDSNGDTFDALDSLFNIATVTIHGVTYALAVSYYDGLQIIDISDPNFPLAVTSVSDGNTDGNGDTFDALYRPSDITTVTIGGVTYSLVTSEDGLQIIDISDPNFPLAVTSISDGDPDSNGDTFDALSSAGDITTVTIGGVTYALVASLFEDAIQIIDISDPNFPLAVISISDGDPDSNGDTFRALDRPSDITTVTIHGVTYALVTSDNGLQIIDISDPNFPLAVISIFDGNTDSNGFRFDALSGASDITTVTIHGVTYALATAASEDAIQIIDISDPNFPLAVTSIFDGDTDSNGDTFDALDYSSDITTVTIGGSTYALIASAFDDGIQIIDISTFSALQLTRVITDNMSGTQMHIPGNYNVKLDLTSLMRNAGSPTIPELDITTDDVIIAFAVDTDVIGLSPANENIEIKASTKTPTGFSSIEKMIELGDPDVNITFSDPVRITLFDQAGFTPFYINAANETFVIANACNDVSSFVNTSQMLGGTGECYAYLAGDLIVWTTHFTTFGSGTLSSTTESNGGGDNLWMTKPTFGLSHHTYKQIVDDGFRFNNNTFQITHNWHTPFPAQNVTLGEQNSFSAKVDAPKTLMIQEFLFGIPEVGMAHKAELGIEVWYNFTGGITHTKILQKTNVVDPDTLFATNEKVKCQESDTTERCYMTLISIKFLEPLKDDIMAIKAIDFERRSQVTFLNEGFNIDGKSLNPMLENNISGTEKNEGLILVTQTAKYSNIWTAEDGREFERNSYGTFLHINHSFERNQDPGEPKTRLHSEFGLIQQGEVERAQATLLEMCPRCNDVSYDKIDNIFQITPSDRNNDISLQEWIVYEGIRAEYVLDSMLKETYPNNPYYKYFRN